MKRLTIPAAAALGYLPGPLLAHGGLDHSSALMVFLHATAHAVNDHTIFAALLGATAVVGLGLYQRRRVRRRASR